MARFRRTIRRSESTTITPTGAVSITASSTEAASFGSSVGVLILAPATSTADRTVRPRRDPAEGLSTAPHGYGTAHGKHSHLEQRRWDVAAFQKLWRRSRQAWPSSAASSTGFWRRSPSLQPQGRRPARGVRSMCERRQACVPRQGARRHPGHRRRLPDALVVTVRDTAAASRGSPADGNRRHAHPRARRAVDAVDGEPGVAVRWSSGSKPRARAEPPPGFRRSTAAGRGLRDRAPGRGMRRAGRRRRVVRSRPHPLVAEPR